MAIIFAVRTDGDGAVFVAGNNAVFYGIFHQNLHAEGWQREVFVGEVVDDVEAIGEAALLERDIVSDKLDLLRKGYQFFAVEGGEVAADVVGEFGYGAFGLLGVALDVFDGRKGVIDEVGLDLVEEQLSAGLS